MRGIEYFDRIFKPSYCRKEPRGVFIIVKSLGSGKEIENAFMTHFKNQNNKKSV